MLYILIILCANLVIIGASLLANLFFPWIFAGYDLWYVILMPPISTVAVIAVDGIGHL